MNVELILLELVAERDRINAAIQALTGGAKAPVQGRGTRTPEQRAAQGEKMRAYWAARKAGKKTRKTTA